MDKILETCPSINSKRQTTATSKAENIELILQEKQQIQKRLENLTEIPPDCTYANSKAVDKQTLMKIFLTLRYERKASEQKDLAQRGIGYHHASVTLKRRQVVEMLFRMGYIWVVTATSTLALGINIPCKSVVFSEDSVYLDAVNYRQMSGRAGRHGQDLIGNVFFYDIPMPKVEKLIKSNVPQLKGNFPFSMSLVLRLMLLAAKADDKVDAKATVLSVLKHPLISFKQPRHNEMLKIYVIFSLQFLLKEGYLDQECNPMGFAGLPIEGSTVFSEDVMETLVLVLANLFGKRYLPACAMNFRKNICQSKVFLEDLPEEFAAAADEYNSKVEKNFACFLLTTAKLADTEQEYKLPLSKIGCFTHGSLAALVKDNWLSEGDAYKLLKDLLLLIKDIRVSLGELCDNPDDKVVLAFQQLSESFEAKLNKV
ncbi:hypothetical protein Y1Q_0021762 [Alligator mississippiensis]|uniref:Helicase C-terminal domain-containing protein n=1 Tax=Alligator mississippiensis TaxID=8496 RepID=A0A151PBT6_ALLMI|nr:hypothetical protein Y1Q_0021762 [Alligator mississippiensis]